MDSEKPFTRNDKPCDCDIQAARRPFFFDAIDGKARCVYCIGFQACPALCEERGACQDGRHTARPAGICTLKRWPRDGN